MKKSILILAMAFGMNVMAQVPTNGLVAYYPFNGNANDASGKGNNGTVNGATLTTDRLGNANSAYSFNGANNYISVTNNATLNFATNNKITVGMWIYPTAYASGSFHKIYLSKQTGSGTSQIGFDCGFTNTHIYLQTRNGSSDNFGGPSYSIALPLNQWIHIVMVKDNSTNYFYYNGNLVTTFTAVSTCGDNSSDLYIGKATWSNINAESFAGKMDEIFIYNRALSASEVSTIYNNCVQPSQAAAPTGTTSLCINPSNTTYTTSGASNATAYVWAISPSNAGTITGIGTTATVDWNNTYTGTANITVKGTNGTGCEGSFSNALTVSINPLPTVTFSVISAVCGSSSAFALTGGSPSSGTYSGIGVSANKFSPVAAGTGTKTLTYTYTDGNGCTNSATQSIIVATAMIYDTTHIAVTDTLIIKALLTGVNPPNNINIIKVYPNPASSHIFIDNGNYSSMNGYSVKITNSVGQSVFQSLINQQQFDVNLSGWSGKGTYFVFIISPLGNTIETRKIILQ